MIAKIYKIATGGRCIQGCFCYSMCMPILILWGILLIAGLFAMYSVSIFESFQLTLSFVKSGIMNDPSNYFYFVEQIKKLVWWIVICAIMYFVPWSTIKKYKYIIFIASLIPLFLLFTPLGVHLNGSTARLQFPGGTIQPGEFFKIGFVLFMGGWLLRKVKQLDEVRFYIAFVIMTGLIYLIFLLIPDLGTILVLAAVAMVMFWFAWGKLYYILVTFMLGIIAAVIAATQFSYIQKRLSYFLDPESDNSGKGVWWQTKQSLVAVGAGWRIGKGYGKWLQKFGYIPEAQSDFIFAAFSEEIWFIGNSIVLTLYFLLARYVLKELKDVDDEYDRLVVVGFLSMIMLQTFINIGVNIKLLPLTGLTLPFFSHGWSALLVNMMEVMLMYKITAKR